MLTVSLKEENQKLKLLVSDNGKGYDPENIRDGSFGTTLMDALTSQLVGNKVISSSQAGTEVSIEFTDYTIAA